MMDKTHSNDLSQAFDGECEREEMSCLLNELICWLFVISIVVFITHHEDGVDEDHKNDEVVKHWPADQLDCKVTDLVAFVQAEARISVEHDELLVPFEFVSCSSKFFLLRAHDVFTEKLHLLILRLSPRVLVTSLGEECHVLGQLLFLLFGVHILLFLQSPWLSLFDGSISVLLNVHVGLGVVLLVQNSVGVQCLGSFGVLGIILLMVD
jgi:hypothetical protein